MCRLFPALFWLMALRVFAAEVERPGAESNSPVSAVAAVPENMPAPVIAPASVAAASGGVVSSSPTPTRVLVIPVRDQIAGYKYPRVVWIRESLPKGPTGKILRRELRP